MSSEICYQAIGVVRSPFQDLVGMPIQPTAAKHIKGSVEVHAEYAEGLRDLDGFSHVILLYHMHEVREAKLIVIPFLDTEPRGVFSTRAPSRPNPIGLSVVRLLKIEQNVLHIENVDILDATPLLDIKPFVPELDQEHANRVGWLEQRRGSVRDRTSDDRFE
jgi:tRNA-Thr(GGU) m(6)t(6)A37 methyltransferase TsaA